VLPVGDAGAEVCDVIKAPLLVEGAIDAAVERATETSAADVTVKVMAAVVQLNSDMGGFVPKGEFQYMVAQYVFSPFVLETVFSQYCTY
jgi:hypothetical protein